MSAQARATELLHTWRDGKGQPHVPSCGQWGGDDCARCTADMFDAWEVFRAAASIMSIPGYTFPDGKPKERAE